MLIFLIKLTLAWGLFALLYILLLRRETFFRANRLYLLGTMVIGIVLPFIDSLLYNLAAVTQILPVFTLPAVTVGVQNAATWTWLDGMYGIYWLGFALTLGRLLWGIARLAGLVVRGQIATLSDGQVVIRSKATTVPFSFFTWIFIPDNYSENADNQRLMLVHERAHVRGWHSCDVVFAELLCVAFWFHPLAHWYRRTLRTIHEYLADADAVRLTNLKQYGLLLIRQAQPGMSLAFANHFFQSPLKQRLIMLTKKTSSSLRALKYALVLPILTVLLLLGQSTNLAAQGKPAKAYAVNEVDEMPEFEGGQEALYKFLGSTIKYPEQAKKENAEGMVVIQFVVDKKGKVRDITTLSKGREDLQSEAVRVIHKMPTWKPGKKDGKAVACIYTLPIKFKLD